MVIHATSFSHMTSFFRKLKTLNSHFFSFAGRGVFAKEAIYSGDFVVEYRGELLSQKDCEKRIDIYPDSSKVFIFEFEWKGECWW